MIFYNKNCISCFKEFKTSRKHTKTCSSTCRSRLFSAQKAVNLLNISCLQCFSMFKTNNPTYKYCSKVCRLKTRYTRESKNLNEKIKKNIRSRVNEAINGKTKRPTILVLLGCSIEEYKIYIESKWQPGMSWDNYGGKTGWQFDHIIPLDSFDLTDQEQLKIACHYTNMQPLTKRDNLKKGNKCLING